jgi:predicted dehydrogenase
MRETRRDFLKSATKGALAVSFAAGTAPFVITARAAEPEKKLGFALVGLGSLSTHQIAPGLQKAKHCRLAGIVSGTPEKRKKWAAQYNIPEKNIYTYETFDKIKDNPDIDVVYVVLPNAMHGEYTIRAAQAGKHVLCEKPMEISPQKCQEMVDACQKNNRLLAIGYRCQFVPFHLELMRISREKQFGALKLIEASFGFKIGDPKQWRLKQALAGGGALMDVGIYALQGTRYVSGEEPVEVTAFESKSDHEKFKEVDESIFWTLKFPSGVIANSGTTYNTNGMNRLYAGFDNGWALLDPAYSYGGLEGKTSKGPMSFPQVDHFATEMDDFAQCIMQNKKSKVSGEAGVRDAKILAGIYESIRSGKTIKLA